MFPVVLVARTHDRSDACRVSRINVQFTKWKEAMSTQEKTLNAKIEFYKVEYERGAQRFNDIYVAIWTNFSYMALVAGGIVTFGSNILRNISSVNLMSASTVNPIAHTFDSTADPWSLEIPALIAMIPLFFWYMATFIPLNEYGDQALERLQTLEKLINCDFDLHLGHYNSIKHPHERHGVLRSPGVRCVVWIFFLTLFIAGLLLSRSIFTLFSQTHPQLRLLILFPGIVVLWGVVVGGIQVLTDIRERRTSRLNNSTSAANCPKDGPASES